MRNHLQAILVLVFALALPACAHAQRLLAVTQAISATREAAAIYLQSADLYRNNLLPGAERLLGNTFDSIQIWPSGQAALVLTSNPPLGDNPAPAWWRSVRPSPFAVPNNVVPAPPSLAASQILKTWEQPGGTHWLVRVSQKYPEHATLHFQPWNAGAGPSTAMEQDLEGQYLAGAPMPGPLGAALLVLQRANGEYFAVNATLSSGAPRLKEFPVRAPAKALDPRPRAALATADGLQYVLFGGYDLAESNAQTASWLAAFTATGTPAGPPLQLLGAPREVPYALVAAPGGACWCITHAPGRDIAYATLVRPVTDGLEKVQQYPLTGVRGALLLSVRENGDVLAAIGERAELWPGGVRGERARSFDAPLGAALWSSLGPVVASAGRIERLDEETLETRATLQCQTGEVRALAEVPESALPKDDYDSDGLDATAELALGTDPRNADSDHDGLHDGADPEPMRPTPTLHVPQLLSFNGDAAGQELHALLVQPASGEDTRWQITYANAELPWLRLYPATSYGRRPVYIGIDPQFHLAPHPLLGVLRAAPLRNLQTKTDPPAHDILLSIRPMRQGPTRILWMLDENAAPNLEQLRTLLSSSPLCLSHRRADSEPADDLGDNNIVVLGTAAAARGDLPQHALLDFVANGGALLVLPDDTGTAARDVSAWFAPLGFRLSTETPLTPPFAAVGNSGPAMAFVAPTAPLPGALIASPADLAVRGADPAGNAGALVLHQYGLGRVAALADLSLADPDRPGNRPFVEALFRWLTRAGLDIQDLDGDGLPDNIEDANGNQALDPGETDRLNSDTDGDGLDDGLEDRNHNGVVDDGETDPRNPDSDGDGIFDGADPTPCPALGAPRILTANPSTGPAEGGTLITINGQNFDNTAACYFGDAPATVRRVLGPDRIEVLSPPFDKDAGATIDLRVDTNSGAAKASLPNGFAYTARSTLKFHIGTDIPGWKHVNAFNGILGIYLDEASDADIGQIVLVLEAQPADALRLDAARPGGAMPQAGHYLKTREVSPGKIMIILGPNLPRPFPSGEIVRIPWEYKSETAPQSPIRILPAATTEGGPIQAAALATHGGPLHVQCTPYNLVVNEDTTRRTTP